MRAEAEKKDGATADKNKWRETKEQGSGSNTI